METILEYNNDFTEKFNEPKKRKDRLIGMPVVMVLWDYVAKIGVLPFPFSTTVQIPSLLYFVVWKASTCGITQGPFPIAL